MIRSLIPVICLFIFKVASAQVTPPAASLSGISLGITGDSSDVQTKTEFGVLLGGGSTDVDEGLKWMIRLSGGGDFIIIRASGSTGYHDYLRGLGGVNSVETLLIDSREKAMLPAVGKKIREAEGLFIAGGDQWNYVRYWSNSEVSSALKYLIETKKVPIGGTSAGCAVLTDIIFDARSGSATAAVLANPYDSLVRISSSFIRVPFLKNTIADQHYSQRERLGRHVVFMARMTRDLKVKKPRGIGVDEKTSVCIDRNGEAKVFGYGNAYFLEATGKPELMNEQRPLTWNRKTKAIKAFIFPASLEGTKAFNVNKWPKEEPTEYWWVENGELRRSPQTTVHSPR